MENKNLLQKILKKHKDLLCNLTRKNKELYYKEGSTSLSLTKAPINKNQKKADKEEYLDTFEPLKMNSEVFKKMIGKSKLSLDAHFQTKDFPNTDLEKRIDKIRIEDNKYQKEFGISGGWLLGPFLLWKQKNLKNIPDIVVSPIFKIPIDVLKKKGKKFELVLEEDSLKLNPTLKLALENLQGLKVEGNSEYSSIEDFLNSFQETLKNQGVNLFVESNETRLMRVPPKTKAEIDESGERKRVPIDLDEFFDEHEKVLFEQVSDKDFIIQDIFVVDHINASKMALYYDYDKILAEEGHDLISQLLLGDKVPEKIDKSKVKEFDKYSERENCSVVDIDSSQHLAIEMSKSQNAIVIQGPPGTGKSQTITNTIAQLLSENQKVLFVSEKRAALDVVFQRLKSSNLKDQTLLVHNSDLDRKEFFKEFMCNYNKEYSEEVKDRWAELTEEINKTKDEAGKIVGELTRECKLSKIPNAEVLLKKSSIVKSNLSIEVASYFSHLDNRRFVNFQKQLSEVIKEIDLVPSYFKNKWFNKKQGLILNAEVKGLVERSILDVKKDLESLEKVKEDVYASDGRSLLSGFIVFAKKILCFFKLFRPRRDIKGRYQRLAELSGYDFSSFSLEEISNEQVQIESFYQDFKYINQVDKIKKMFKDIEESFELTGLEEFFKNKLRLKSDPVSYLGTQMALYWYDSLITESETIRNFDSKDHSSTLEKYIYKDEERKDLASHFINYKFAKNKENTQSISPSMLKLINKEASKQRRIKPPRELMEKGALETMVSLKRCWLMSPLSISQVLPNEKEIFDVVIFDEASQVKIEDAVPTIFRSKRMIVVGDNKQMPPTNFFSGLNYDDDYDDDEDFEIGESVLDQALKSCMGILLEWHYRSQNSSLIEFSNRAFYGGRLIAPPSPRSLNDESPISLCNVSEATFKSREGNTVEAKAIVDEVADILIADPGASVGVISMGVSQQKAIEKELDMRAEADEGFLNAYEKAMNYEEDGAFVGFFNKNLENVQGDERDYIIISVGYAPSTIGGKLRKQFGPLSKKGGGRRLNVAITRAKKYIKIFCSFDPNELDISDESFAKNPDGTTFSRYLHYAKAISDSNRSRAEEILNMYPVSGLASQRKPSNFNLDVKTELEKLGYSISTEIGTCGFYIDLGVEHPNVEGTYILGIECDGAIFHSTPYMRDRDKTRQKLLEGRGWNIHRIWSTDWSKERSKEIEKLDQKIKSLI